VDIRPNSTTFLQQEAVEPVFFSRDHITKGTGHKNRLLFEFAINIGKQVKLFFVISLALMPFIFNGADVSIRTSSSASSSSRTITTATTRIKLSTCSGCKD
jgi:hypothetical protein